MMGNEEGPVVGGLSDVDMMSYISCGAAFLEKNFIGEEIVPGELGESVFAWCRAE